MALICRDLRRFARSLSLFRWNASLPLSPSIRPPCPSPSAARTARVFRSIRQIHFARFPFLRIDSACVQSGRTTAKRLSRHAKNPRNRTIDEWTGDEEEMDIPLYPFLSLADERMRILIARATRKKNKGSKGREEGVTKRNGCLGWSNAIEAGFVAKGTIGKEERRGRGGGGQAF